AQALQPAAMDPDPLRVSARQHLGPLPVQLSDLRLERAPPDACRNVRLAIDPQLAAEQVDELFLRHADGALDVLVLGRLFAKLDDRHLLEILQLHSILLWLASSSSASSGRTG